MTQEINGFTVPDDGDMVFGSDLKILVQTLVQLQEETDPITGDQDIWIDPVNGEDGANRGSEQRPFKTFAAVEESGLLPKLVLRTTRIWVKEGEMREHIRLDGYTIVGGDLIFLAVPDQDPFPTTPFPWSLIFQGLRAPVGLQGAISGTATGGTKRTIQMSSGNWIPGELKNKFWVVTGGTGMFSWGRVLDNTATEFEVSGYWSSPFDATSEFYLAEEAVVVRPPDGDFNTPLQLYSMGGGNQFGMYGFRFEMQTGYQYSSRVGYLLGNTAWIQFSYCSFIGNDYPVTVGPMSSQTLIWIQTNWGALRFSSCAFWMPDLPAGKFSGAMWPFGPNGPMEFRDCVSNDNFQFYYGQTGLSFQSCSIRYRPNMLEMNVSRGVGWFRMYSCYIDGNGRSYCWRFDGPESLDCRDSYFEGAPSDGLVSFKGHQGEGAHLYLARVQIDGCGGDGIHVEGNSLVSIWNVTTDAGNKNGAFGIRVGSGSQIRYQGTNTITGTSGDINLGDGATAVSHGVEQTDTTHLTRVSQA